jgi:hypothetical protein
VEESKMIEEVVMRAPDKAKYEGTATAREWFIRRIKNQRTKNQVVSD